jgi:Sec-independent protein translocase protein TatA
MGPDLSCKTKTMKPQIIITVSFLVLASMLFSATANAAGSSVKKVKTESKNIQLPYDANTDKAEQPAQSPKSNKPSKPRSNRDNHEKESMPPKEAGTKKAHSDEDGKHHHFHMHRAKKIKRLVSLVCFIAKLLLVITHICLLAYVLNAPFAH